jgi:class 3 adenylate cyclase
MKLPTLSALRGFPDPALERRYRFEQRTGQALWIARLVLVAGAGIVLYWISVLATAPLADALAIVSRQAVFVVILAGFSWAIRRPLYADAWWLDVLLFALVLPFLLLSQDRLLASQDTGWTLPGLLTYGLQTTLACACLVFAAAVRSFLFLVALAAVFLAAVLESRGYPAEIVTYTQFNFLFFGGVIWFLNQVIDRKARAAFLARESLAIERAKSERLLVNMLPEPVAARLKSKEAIADRFDDLVVVFVDLVGFTTLSERLGAERIVELLNAYFERADHACDLFELEKVKTIGDAYMAIAGAITRPPRPAKAAIDFAVHLRAAAAEAGRGFGVDLRLHAGIARGPAIGGVISAKRISYDYWGPTINLGARLMDAAGADGIAVSEAVHRAVADSYAFHPPRTIALKGLGETAVYDLDLAAG